MNSQYADGESNKIVYDKKKTVTVWMFNTYTINTLKTINYKFLNKINYKITKH